MSLAQWFEEHKANFLPPVCNCLLHRDQLSVMFVGGPNTREDFHIEDGAEFFYQLKGEMRLPTIQKGGRRKEVVIPAGSVFLLPPRVPHSPQRPDKASLGLVVERRREGGEMDALRFYGNAATCEERLFERYFACTDLGKDLKPIIDQFKASEEIKTRKPGPGALPEKRLIQEADINVPEPFDLMTWVTDHETELSIDGSSIPLFPKDHPDDEFVILIEGFSSESKNLRHAPKSGQDTLVVQLRGTSLVHVEVVASANSETAKKRRTRVTHTLEADGYFVIGAGQSFAMERAAGSL